MRVCVVTTSYPSHEGDPAGHFVEEEVRELQRADYDVVVVRPEAGGAFGWPGVAARIRDKPWRAFDAAAWMARAAVELRAAKADRVIAHWAVPSGLLALAAGAHAELELVSHGGDVRLLRAMPARARTELTLRLARRATKWRFVSSELRSALLGALPDAVATQVSAIAAVEPSPLGMPDVRAAAQAHRVSIGERRLYVCAGRLVPSKRVDKVIDYVAGERHTRPVLVILGDGPERQRLERLATRWQIDVRFLGTTRRHEALAWIGAADELVHASEAEGLSTVLREAEELGVRVTLVA
jgi:teichuronic acid biosynthesis glycosyltransferase TuaC